MTKQTNPAALVKAVLERAGTAARMAMVANRDADEMTCSICAKDIRALAADPEAVVEIIEQVKGKNDE